MPKENKHARGRRDLKKEKRKRTDDEAPVHHAKRRKSVDADYIQFVGTDNAEPGADEAYAPVVTERPFYGLLDDEEQEYFRRTDELLELNDFPSEEDRSLFLANVYREAEGKELKIANSQSCSRLMERLILLSSPDQKKKLFEKFSGHFLHLIQHRFASHCCETLFIESASVVTQELLGDVAEAKGEEQAATNRAHVYVSMENLFLYTLNELEGHMGFLLTDKHASHSLRVLLVVLSGQPLAKSSTRSLLQSRKKEKIGITGLDTKATEVSLKMRTVPESFQFAVSKIISDTIAGLDTTFIHVLATHPTGNPTLQLLLELELTRQTKQKQKSSTELTSIIAKLLPDDIAAPDSQSASFINGLIYEPIGSRLLETIVTFAQGKLFKQIYRTTFKERIGSLARNEIASFVVIKVLERLSRADLEEAVTLILPQIPGLIERSRTTVIKTLLERCNARGATESITLLTKSIEESYGSDPDTLLLKMTHFTPSLAKDPDLETSKPPAPANPMTLHGSLLAQTMLATPGPPTLLLQSSLLALSPTTLISLALTTTTSHLLQAALAPSSANVSFRRRFISHLLFSSPQDRTRTEAISPGTEKASTTSNPSTKRENDAEATPQLALSKPGSHVLDAIARATVSPPSLMVLRERVCTVLLQNTDMLRADFVGRVVLRNWGVELFGRRRAEWVRRVREEGSAVGMETEVQEKRVEAKRDSSKREGQNRGGRGGKLVNSRSIGAEKTAIQLAREKFASGKVRKGFERRGRATGANAT